MQLWLVPSSQPHTQAPPPFACPRAGCGSRRLRLHQSVAKPVRDVAPRSAAARRYACRACGRTFRVYPAGVDGGDVAVGVKRFAAALHLLGLSVRDVSRALAVLGVPLGKSRVHGVVAPVLRGLRMRKVAPLLERVVAAAPGSEGEGAATVRIHGRALPLRRALDDQGRVGLVVDGIDARTRLAVAQWARATLAGFGVRVDVVFPPAPRRRRGAGEAAPESAAESAATRSVMASSGPSAAVTGGRAACLDSAVCGRPSGWMGGPWGRAPTPALRGPAGGLGGGSCSPAGNGHRARTHVRERIPGPVPLARGPRPNDWSWIRLRKRSAACLQAGAAARSADGQERWSGRDRSSGGAVRSAWAHRSGAPGRGEVCSATVTCGSRRRAAPCVGRRAHDGMGCGSDSAWGVG